jgi:O-antigen ligase
MDSGFRQRLDFGYKNAQHTAVYASFSFFVLFFLRKSLVSRFSGYAGYAINALMFLGMFYVAWIVVAAQSRASWLGMVAAAAVYVAYLVITMFMKAASNDKGADKGWFSKKYLYSSLVAVALLSVILYSLPVEKIITKRLSVEQDVIADVVEGNTENVRLSSVGIRITLWGMASDWIRERPLTGWGPQTRKMLIYQEEQPDWMKQRMRHLHNSYLDLLVDYGFVGFLLFAGLFTYIWYRAWQAWKARLVPDDVLLFAAIWCVYWLIVNTFESYVIYSVTGQYLNAIVAGVLYTYHLKRKHLEKAD